MTSKFDPDAPAFPTSAPGLLGVPAQGLTKRELFLLVAMHAEIVHSGTPKPVATAKEAQQMVTDSCMRAVTNVFASLSDPGRKVPS